MANAAAELLLKVKTVGDEAVDGLADKFGKVGAVATAAFAAISAVVVKSLLDYREQEVAVNALTQSMVNQGIYTKALKDDYIKLSGELQKASLYGDEQIIAAQAVMQSYLGQTKVSRELLTATMDLAAAKKMDLASAAELVGKSIGTETNALKRQGIELTAGATQAERLGQVLDGLSGKFGGQAKAATEGLGSLQQLSNVMSDLYETIGEQLAPVVTLISQKMIKFGTDTNETGPFIEGFLFIVKSLAMGVSVLYDTLQTTSNFITTGFAGGIKAIAALVQGDFIGAFAAMKETVVENFDNVVNGAKKTFENLVAIDDAFLASKKENIQKEAALVAESNANKDAVAAETAASDNALKLERMIAEQQIEMGILQAGEEQKAMAILQARIKRDEALLKQTTDSQKREALLKDIYLTQEQQKQLTADEQMKANRKDTLATMATLSKSGNQTLAMIGKAAAIAEIAIQTPLAISKALGAAPPPINFALAGVVGAAMAAQAANVAGVQLADGGIVKATPGGIQATIGEGGQDEMVVPLDRAREFGLGGGGGGQTVINFNGPVMGDAAQAREFAIAVDRELLNLRRNNESVAFDSGVI